MQLSSIQGNFVCKKIELNSNGTSPEKSSCCDGKFEPHGNPGLVCEGQRTE